ncbi:MAG: cupredoxin domain-containing protein [Nitrospirae bacterium]|nr:cupredoxin domain-containing protein [Nitrospirota bacterium]MDE3049727.1 hypothetical protein [Nitrospirota bacterium]
MRYIVGSAAAVTVFALATVAGAQLVQKGIEVRPVNAEVVMKDKAFHITQGESTKGIMLIAGSQANIRLRNEDTVAHEFVSTLLYNLPFQVMGSGTFVKAPKAAGIRVDPGQTVVLSFEVPYDSKEFQDLYEVFFCNIHGTMHGDKMRGEILVLDQRGEIGGG